MDLHLTLGLPLYLLGLPIALVIGVFVAALMRPGPYLAADYAWTVAFAAVLWPLAGGVAVVIGVVSLIAAAIASLSAFFARLSAAQDGASADDTAGLSVEK